MARPSENSTSVALEAGRVVKARPGVLFGLSGYSAKAGAQFIQLHDAASEPAEGSVPAFFLPAPSGSEFSVDYGPPPDAGRYFANGIYVCNSSTGPTKTLAAADCFFDAQYA